MVGDSAGIRISAACLAPHAATYTSVQSSDGSGSGSDWAKSAASAIRCADLAIDLLQFLLARQPLLQQTRLHLLDRIVLLAHLLHLLPGAVLGRVGHGVAAIAIGQHLEDVGSIAGAAMRTALSPASLHGPHIHAVDLLAGDAEGRAAGEELLGAGSERGRPPCPWRSGCSR